MLKQHPVYQIVHSPEEASGSCGVSDRQKASAAEWVCVCVCVCATPMTASGSVVASVGVCVSVGDASDRQKACGGVCN